MQIRRNPQRIRSIVEKTSCAFNWKLIVTNLLERNFSQLYQWVSVGSGVFSIELFARILLHCKMFNMISNSVMHLHNEFTVSRLPYCCNKENICVANNRHHCPRSFIQISVQLTGMHWPFWPVLTNENFKSIRLICRIKLIFFLNQFKFKLFNNSQK